MYIHCYLRRGVVYIPTLGKVDGGPYYDIEPVAVVGASNTESLRVAFAEAIKRGNPNVASINRPNHPPPILLKYAGLKSWNTFARDTSIWGIEERNGILQIEHFCKDRPGGWTREEEKDENFPPGTTVAEMIERMIAILQAAATHKPSR